jgi:peptidoglycan hydrolase CwlO-like protein
MKRANAPVRITERLTRGIGSVPSLIVHTVFFIACFVATAVGLIELNTMLLILTTLVSLEAIYLAIFIQMTVNENTESLREVEEDIDEIQEDVEELGEDMDEIQEDIDEMQEDLEEMTEEEKKAHDVSIEQLTENMRQILKDLEALKKVG